jgi:hypothetical protein
MSAGWEPNKPAEWRLPALQLQNLPVIFLLGLGICRCSLIMTQQQWPHSSCPGFWGWGVGRAKQVCGRMKVKLSIALTGLSEKCRTTGKAEMASLGFALQKFVISLATEKCHMEILVCTQMSL